MKPCDPPMAYKLLDAEHSLASLVHSDRHSNISVFFPNIIILLFILYFYVRKILIYELNAVF